MSGSLSGGFRLYVQVDKDAPVLFLNVVQKPAFYTLSDRAFGDTQVFGSFLHAKAFPFHVRELYGNVSGCDRTNPQAHRRTAICW